LVYRQHFVSLFEWPPAKHSLLSLFRLVEFRAEVANIVGYSGDCQIIQVWVWNTVDSLLNDL
jgi:hypothetical protein